MACNTMNARANTPINFKHARLQVACVVEEVAQVTVPQADRLLDQVRFVARQIAFETRLRKCKVYTLYEVLICPHQRGSCRCCCMLVPMPMNEQADDYNGTGAQQNRLLQC